MAQKHSITFYLVLLHLIIMPLVPLKVYAGPLPISAEVVLIPVLTVVAAYEWYTKRIKLHDDLSMKTFMVLFGLFFLIQVISLTQAESLFPGIKEMVRYLSYAVLFYIVTKVNFSRSEFKTIGITFSIVLALVGIWGILTYVFAINLNTAGVYALEEAYGRVMATMGNPNYYAGFINFVIPGLLLVGVAYFKERKWQLMFFALFGIYVINQIFTYTRSAWLIMALAIILTSLLVPKRFYKKLFTIHMIVASIVLAIVVYNLPDVQDRTKSAMFVVQSFFPEDTTSPGGGVDRDGDGVEDDDSGKLNEKDEKNKSFTNKAVVSRTTLWKTGYYMYKDNPVLGVGIGNYDVRYKEYVTKYPQLYIGHDQYSVHNSYLKVASETGTIGLLSFLAIYVYYYIFMVKQYIIHREDLLKKLMLVGLFVGAGTFAGQNIANNLIFIPQVNVLFWLISGLVFNYVHSKHSRA